MNVRVACARVLAAVIRQEASLSSLLPDFAHQVPERDVNLLAELCYGTLRHFHALRVISDHLLAKPLKNRDADVLALILAGLYQIRELRTPAHAAVNESVTACNALKKGWARGLVNSILRTYLRDRAAIDARCEGDDRYVTGHPRWLQRRLRTAWGDDAAGIMAANNLRPPMTLRVNRLRGSRPDYLAALAEAGIGARPAGYSPCGIYLDSPCDVAALPGFREGRVSVQDEAAQLCAGLLELAPGQRVLDSCAAPGGKACHLLETEPALGELVALDVDGGRLDRVRDNLARLELTATLATADAGDTAGWWDGRPFDRILLDAPCSATGVIRRHPDIKVLRRDEDIATLAATQGRLLRSLWPTLAAGGRLLYATCSVLPDENDQVVASFVADCDDCRVLDIAPSWGTRTTMGRQLLPTADGPDGFYYALLGKR